MALWLMRGWHLCAEISLECSQWEVPLWSEQSLGCRPSRDEPMPRAALGTTQPGDIRLFLIQLTTGRCWPLWFSSPLSTLKIRKCSLSKGESITAVYILDTSVGETAKCDGCLFKICFTGRASLNTCLFFLSARPQGMAVVPSYSDTSWRKWG